MTLRPTSEPPTLVPTNGPSQFPTLVPTSAPEPPVTVDVHNVTKTTTSVEKVNGQTITRVDIVHNLTHTTTFDERGIPASAPQWPKIEARPVYESEPPQRPDTEVPWWAQAMGAHIPPAQPITPGGYPQIYIYAVNHADSMLYFALHGKRYNEIPPHGVNRQAAFGHEVWQIVDAQNRLILQAETTEANQRFIIGPAAVKPVVTIGLPTTGSAAAVIVEQTTHSTPS